MKTPAYYRLSDMPGGFLKLASEAYDNRVAERSDCPRCGLTRIAWRGKAPNTILLPRRREPCEVCR